MIFSITTATKKVARLTKRIRAVQGGTSASKTISILQLLIHKSQTDTTPRITSIVSESLPHLRKGAMRDFLTIMEAHGYFDDARWNKTDSIYTFESGSIVEFFGADQPAKVRGPRRDRLYMNECNNMAFETFEQLEVRTREEIYLDWNPTNEFWFYTNVLNDRDDVDHLILTYKDNEALEKTIVDSIEQRRERKDWWQVFGLGLLGELEGKIYTDWNLNLEEVPHSAKLVRYGLDFGYTNDPTAIVAIYEHDGGLILDEILFQKGLLNSQIAAVIQNQEKNVIVVADSAEPKSIDDIASYGISIIPTTKGRDSVKQGIDLVKDQRISVTKRSVNVINEYRNYLWEVDKNGKVLNVPEHTYSHSMDAIRYGVVSLPRLVQPLTEEQKSTKRFLAAMKRKKEGYGVARVQGKRERLFNR
jgi:phage terminase large subunit